MKGFKVSIEGKNIFFRNPAGTKKMGFYATRYVQAPSSAEAEDAAIRMVLTDKKLRDSICNPPGNAPKIFVIDSMQSSISEDDISNNNLFFLYEEKQD